MRAWIRTEPVLCGVLLATAVVALALIGWGRVEASANARRAATIGRAAGAWERLADRALAPTEANVIAARAHLEALEGLAARLRRQLRAPHGWPPGPVRTDREKLLFSVLEGVEAERRAMAEAGVALSLVEQFGYGQMVRDQQVRFAAPDDPAAVAVALDRLARQRIALGWVLDALRAAHPARLLAVERAAVQAWEPKALVAMEDVFVVDPGVTAAVPGAIETGGIRVQFTGRTAVLRDFLSGLEGAGRPLVVRRIEVHPVAAAAEGTTTAAGASREASGSPLTRLFGTPDPAAVEPLAAPGAVPIVAANESVFTVVLEAYRLVDHRTAGASGPGGMP